MNEEKKSQRKKQVFEGDESIFASNLKATRESQKLTQAELAEKAGLSATIISEYESTSKIPKIHSVKKLAQALNISIDMLCGNTPTFQFKKKLENSTIYAILTALDHLKPQVHVAGNQIIFTISTDNDCPNYSSHEILKFFEEYEIIQNFGNSIATDDMIKVLIDNLEEKYKHLPKLPAYIYNSIKDTNDATEDTNNSADK